MNVNVPTLFPAATVPLTIVVPQDPFPCNLPVVFIVTVDDNIDPLTINVPSLTVVDPEYVFVLVNNNVPEPDFNNDDDPDITPDNVINCEPTFIIDGDDNDILFVKVTTPPPVVVILPFGRVDDIITSLPVEISIVPIELNGLEKVTDGVDGLNDNVPELLMDDVLLIVPLVIPSPNCNFPALIVVVPVYKLGPVNINVPKPVFVIFSEFAGNEDDIVIVFSLNTSRIPIELNVFEKVINDVGGLNDNVPVLITDNVLSIVPLVTPSPNCNIPELIVVAPVYKLVPVNINVPEPALITFDEIAGNEDDIVTVFDEETLSVPIDATNGTVNVTDDDDGLNNNVPALVIDDVLLIVPFVVPSPNCNVPLLIVVVPVYKFVPVNINVPDPVLVTFDAIAGNDDIVTVLDEKTIKVPIDVINGTANVIDDDDDDGLNDNIPALLIDVVLLIVPLVVPFPNCNVPALIVVVPEYVFAPVNVNVPVPALIRFCAPEIIPDINVVPLFTVIVVGEVNATLDDKDNVPLPCFIIFSTPEIKFDNVIVPLFTFIVVGEDNVILDDTINVPLPVCTKLNDGNGDDNVTVFDEKTSKVPIDVINGTANVIDDDDDGLNDNIPVLLIDVVLLIVPLTIPFPNCNIPALIVVVPEYVFAPINVNLPVPALIKFCAPEIIPDIDVVPLFTVIVVCEVNATLDVKDNVPIPSFIIFSTPEIKFVNVIVPPFTFIVVGEDNVILDDTINVPLPFFTKLNDGNEDNIVTVCVEKTTSRIPIDVINGTANVVDDDIGLNANIPALLIDVVLLIVPFVDPFPNCNVPALIVVVPEYVFPPVNINVPVPALIKSCAPEITPDINVVPLFTVIVVGEVNATLDGKVKVPAPSFIIFSTPEIKFGNVIVPLFTFIVVGEDNVILDDTLNVPLPVFTKLNNGNEDDIVTVFDEKTLKVPIDVINGTVNVIDDVNGLNANIPALLIDVVLSIVPFVDPLFPNCNVPALIVVVPEYVFTPVNDNVPTPTLIKSCAPEITPDINVVPLFTVIVVGEVNVILDGKVNVPTPSFTIFSISVIEFTFGNIMVPSLTVIGVNDDNITFGKLNVPIPYLTILYCVIFVVELITVPKQFIVIELILPGINNELILNVFWSDDNDRVSVVNKFPAGEDIVSVPETKLIDATAGDVIVPSIINVIELQMASEGNVIVLDIAEFIYIVTLSFTVGTTFGYQLFESFQFPSELIFHVTEISADLKLFTIDCEAIVVVPRFKNLSVIPAGK